MIKITTGEQNVFATNKMTLTRQIIIGNPRYNSKIIINVLNYENFHIVCGSLHCIYTYVYIAQHIRYRTYCIPTANIFLGNPVPTNYRESTRGALEQRYIKK